MHRVLATAVPRCLSTFILAALPLSAEKTRRAQAKVAAVEVSMIESDEIPLPAEFLVALYENLLHQLEKQGFFGCVPAGGPQRRDCRRSRCSPQHRPRLQGGSETERKVTTVAGATSITVHCQFTRPDGTPVLERDMAVNVRFFGANLRQPMNLQERRLM
jgi:serine/threonine-protein kinase RsbW